MLRQKQGKVQDFKLWHQRGSSGYKHNHYNLENWYRGEFAFRLTAQRYRMVLGQERTVMVDCWGVDVGNAWEVNRDGTCNLRKGEWGIMLGDANG